MRRGGTELPFLSALSRAGKGLRRPKAPPLETAGDSSPNPFLGVCAEKKPPHASVRQPRESSRGFANPLESNQIQRHVRWICADSRGEAGGICTFCLRPPGNHAGFQAESLPPVDKPQFVNGKVAAQQRQPCLYHACAPLLPIFFFTMESAMRTSSVLSSTRETPYTPTPAAKTISIDR